MPVVLAYKQGLRWAGSVAVENLTGFKGLVQAVWQARKNSAKMGTFLVHGGDPQLDSFKQHALPYIWPKVRPQICYIYDMMLNNNKRCFRLNRMNRCYPRPWLGSAGSIRVVWFDGGVGRLNQRRARRLAGPPEPNRLAVGQPNHRAFPKHTKGGLFATAGATLFRRYT